MQPSELEANWCPSAATTTIELRRRPLLPQAAIQDAQRSVKTKYAGVAEPMRRAIMVGLRTPSPRSLDDS
jgi:hypothetical protein